MKSLILTIFILISNTSFAQPYAFDQKIQVENKGQLLEEIDRVVDELFLGKTPEHLPELGEEEIELMKEIEVDALAQSIHSMNITSYNENLIHLTAKTLNDPASREYLLEVFKRLGGLYDGYNLEKESTNWGVRAAENAELAAKIFGVIAVTEVVARIAMASRGKFKTPNSGSSRVSQLMKNSWRYFFPKGTRRQRALFQFWTNWRWQAVTALGGSALLATTGEVWEEIEDKIHGERMNPNLILKLILHRITTELSISTCEISYRLKDSLGNSEESENWLTSAAVTPKELASALNLFKSELKLVTESAKEYSTGIQIDQIEQFDEMSRQFEWVQSKESQDILSLLTLADSKTLHEKCQGTEVNLNSISVHVSELQNMLIPLTILSSQVIEAQNQKEENTEIDK